ncbi:large conductance mechanosensitive channel protein MscL [Jiella sp. MQZ9-1]|uniref:Large-conductance mechanosensitive channel n=1 Tax=Jiella flava TaxID=2816857 RepID=A0A939JVE1_9HYPH|nr:large conductance mechanosensitive channel protein MscL [Jiella flava]MBO0661882.1 large conductance mechanosensitive channel protein MscL [Jiella flava]MCD2470790.1 large conductance mechanosensitive channel protein MscL [Jiella flava]
MLKEFREFALKGNMVDLAIGIIIGAAFSGLVNSIVTDLFMPLVGVITGGVDFTNKFVPLAKTITATSLDEARKQGPVFAYGRFITLTINFVIVAFILFLIVKLMNRLKRKEEEKPAPVADVPREEKLLEEIRDILAARSGVEKQV